MKLKLLILTESPNIFHWNSVIKVKWVWSVEQNLGQIWYNVKKQRKTGISMVFYILHEAYIYKHKEVVIKIPD